MQTPNKLSQKGLKTLIEWLKKEVQLEPMKPDVQSYQALADPKTEPKIPAKDNSGKILDIDDRRCGTRENAPEIKE